MSDPELWNEVDEYVRDALIGADPVLDGALESAQQAGLPPIAVSAPQGKFLFLLARAIGARRILEIGTLGGYSTIWLARALAAGGDGPGLTSLELEPRHAEVARANLERAGVSDRVDIRVGPALESLPKLAADGVGPFDLAFVDADKENIPAYFDWSVKLSHPGAVIVVDNVVRDGALVDPTNEDERIRSVRRFHEQLTTRSDVEATTIQTVGSKGYDGFTFAFVKP